MGKRRVNNSRNRNPDALSAPMHFSLFVKANSRKKACSCSGGATTLPRVVALVERKAQANGGPRVHDVSLPRISANSNPAPVFPIPSLARLFLPPLGRSSDLPLFLARRPRFFCDFCDSDLTHDSENARKQHHDGFKHKANVRNYYAQFQEQVAERSQTNQVENSPAVAYQMQVNRVLQQQQMGAPGGYGGYPPMGGGPKGGPPPGGYGGYPPKGGGPMGGPPPGMGARQNFPPPPGGPGYGR